MNDMMVDILAGYTMPFGKHKGHALGCVYDTDFLYLMWLAKQDWVEEEYPEVAAYLEAVDVPLFCPGIFDGEPCPRPVQPCGWCYAHSTAQYEGRSMDLRSCLLDGCNGAARDNGFCFRHRGRVKAVQTSPQ